MRTKRLLLIAILTLAALFGGGVYLVATSIDAVGSSKANEKKPAKPVNLIGHWTGSVNDLVFDADISAGQIQINLKPRDDTSSIYWMGTFDTDLNGVGSFTEFSHADQDALASSIFGSQDKTKKFTYRDGELSFDFTMLGSTTTVHLTK